MSYRRRAHAVLQAVSPHTHLFCIIILAVVSVMSIHMISDAEYARGHGTSSESFPPTDLNGQQVTLEISSSAPPPPETTGRPPAGIKQGEDLQIAMALVDFESKVTLRDVTFSIRAERGDTFLFEQEFKADGGFLVFNFASANDTGKITVDDTGSADGAPDVLAYLLGTESRMVDVAGPRLADGGLYRFEIAILTAGSYEEPLDAPLTYESGISIPQIITYGVEDPNFGDQYIRVITYYDEISGFEYDSESTEIRFSMPFEWSESNLNQSYVVHQELAIPDTYGDLLVSGFETYINGVRLPDGVTVIDDFFVGERIIHFIIPQEMLYDVRNKSSSITSTSNKMDFVTRPDTDRTRLSSVTENGQFRIFASWDPEDLQSGQDAKIMFEITDVFLKNLPIAADYRFSVTTTDDRTVFEQTGTSTDSRENPAVTAEFAIPDDISGIVHLNFDDIDRNERAKTSMPIVIDRIKKDAIVDDGRTGLADDDYNAIKGAQTGGSSPSDSPDAPDKDGGGCLIATAIYGTELAPQVQRLRELRDDTILGTASGTMFMSGFNAVYYTFSPTISDIQRENPVFKEATKMILTPMLYSFTMLEHASIDTESDMIAYGLAVIVINAAMYVILPVSTCLLLAVRLQRGRMPNMTNLLRHTHVQ